jgi:hypothetical protein
MDGGCRYGLPSVGAGPRDAEVAAADARAPPDVFRLIEANQKSLYYGSAIDIVMKRTINLGERLWDSGSACVSSVDGWECLS